MGQVESRRYPSSPKTTQVIKSIYSAVCRYDASFEIAVAFTSIAMHNMYTFYQFTPVDRGNFGFEIICRGLLQIKSRSYYEKLTVISNRDYVSQPWLLDEFTSISVSDEFNLFIKVFATGPFNIKRRFFTILKLLGACDSLQITDEIIEQLTCGTFAKDANEINRRIYRRYQIYFYLYTNLLCYNQAIVVV